MPSLDTLSTGRSSGPTQPSFLALLHWELSADAGGPASGTRCPPGQGALDPLVGLEVPRFTFIRASMLLSKVKLEQKRSDHQQLCPRLPRAFLELG